jgi:hypothetical protein
VKGLEMNADYSDEYIERLLTDLRSKDYETRRFATKTLAEPACHARAIPALIKMLDDNTVIYENPYDAFGDDYLLGWQMASDTLKKIGEPAIPALIAALPPTVQPTDKYGLLHLLTTLKARDALAPMLELYHADHHYRSALINAIENLVVPAQDAALVVPYLLQFYREFKPESRPAYRTFDTKATEQLAKLLRPYAVPAARFIYWRWRIFHTLVMAFALIFAMLFLAVLILLGILSVPIMFVVSGIQKIRQRFFPPPPKVIKPPSSSFGTNAAANNSLKNRASGAAFLRNATANNPFNKRVPSAPSEAKQPLRHSSDWESLTANKPINSEPAMPTLPSSETDTESDSSKE